MSALIIREVERDAWIIIRQSPKITRTSVESPNISFGRVKGIHIISSSYADFTKEGVFYIQGSSYTSNNRVFRVPPEWRERFIKAVVELNRKYSNNTKIDEEDVIIRISNGTIHEERKSFFKTIASRLF
jgi:hypothetical protein